ncbi:FAD-dependent monooxygenase [Streptomyces sp. NPDC102473]|uniref:FAD-dependent monooxygenase n=1 Tax=Streptomyces sp. NPDC102473 TaxID=3366180 RepID=UPI003813E3BB
MAPDRLETQVIVVGAGPVGLMLAGELRLGGVDVVVLEQRRGPTQESRASTLHARTMEILDSRGLLPDFGEPPNEPRGHFGGIPLDLALPGPYPGQWKVPQARTEAVLEEWVLSLGADIRCGHELHELRTADDDEDRGADGGYVEAVAAGREGDLTVRGSFLVACDGEDSTVRRLTGARFPGQDARRELLRADVEGIEVPGRRFERLPDGLAIAARRDGVTRVMVHEFGSTAPVRTGDASFDEIVTAWKRVTGEDISGGTPLWVNSFGDTNRQLVHYRHGRVLFAGDAAHRQMPIGGQALNLGLQDAFNLGWKLAAALGGAPPELLDTYHDERHAVGRRVLANIRAQAMMLLGGPEVNPLRAVLTELIAHEDVRAHLAGMISGLDVRYRVGGPAHRLLGTRLPPTRLRVGDRQPTTTELLRAPRCGLLLDLRDGPAGTPAATPPDDRIAVVRAAPAHPGSALEGVGRVLVRPDGHVAWAADHGDDGLPAALDRWFGPRR